MFVCCCSCLDHCVHTAAAATCLSRERIVREPGKNDKYLNGVMVFVCVCVFFPSVPILVFIYFSKPLFLFKPLTFPPVNSLPLIPLSLSFSFYYLFVLCYTAAGRASPGNQPTPVVLQHAQVRPSAYHSAVLT